MNRAKRAAMAQETVEIIANGQYQVGTEVVEIGDLLRASYEGTCSYPRRLKSAGCRL